MKSDHHTSLITDYYKLKNLWLFGFNYSGSTVRLSLLGSWSPGTSEMEFRPR